MKVAVIDDGPLCGGETGRTTAHLANEIDVIMLWLADEYVIVALAATASANR